MTWHKQDTIGALTFFLPSSSPYYMEVIVPFNVSLSGVPTAFGDSHLSLALPAGMTGRAFINSPLGSQGGWCRKEFSGLVRVSTGLSLQDLYGFDQTSAVLSLDGVWLRSSNSTVRLPQVRLTGVK